MNPNVCPQCKKPRIDTVCDPYHSPGKPQAGDTVTDTCGYCGWKSVRTFRGPGKGWTYHKVTGRLSKRKLADLRAKNRGHKRQRPRGMRT